MNRNGIQSLADAGRFGDTELIHATKGEVVIPPTILNKNPSLLQAIRAELAKEDTSLDEITVGSQLASINPQTGLQEFFLKSLFKKVKKIGSKLVRGAKKVFKKVAPVGLGLLIPGVGGALSGVLAGAGSALGIPAGIGSKFLGGSGILQTLGKARGNIASGLGSLFGGSASPSSTGGGGGSAGGGSTGSFFGKKTPGFIKKIEDLIKEGPGKFKDYTGIDPFFAVLAKQYGDEVEDAVRERMGGVADIRDTLRPDLAANVYGGTPSFDLGFAQGGAVMDMREGGESIGPGTGTSDDIPAMLSDGEFVMTAKANMGAGAVDLVEDGGIMQLIPAGDPSRAKGADNMMKLMRYFEGLS